ncbi:MAG TPA: hypothetical protein PKC69_16250 [Chitinophagaceae bacterium]|nr:hypothetical protein [Chitinophagaceae bacterium]
MQQVKSVLLKREYLIPEFVAESYPGIISRNTQTEDGYSLKKTAAISGSRFCSQLYVTIMGFAQR